MTPSLVLVAHGTRNPRGVEMIAELAEAVSERVGTTRVAFVDVLGPSPSEVLREMSGPAVVVPAFLASGYHVHTDVPREIEDSGHTDVVVTRALGPDPVFAHIMIERLRAAGWRDGDAVVFAAAGSSDVRAQLEHRRAAAMLADAAGVPVRIGYIAITTEPAPGHSAGSTPKTAPSGHSAGSTPKTAPSGHSAGSTPKTAPSGHSAGSTPAVPHAVAALRADGHQRVFVASYLLARGLFHTRLADAGADGVADPLGLHDGIIDLVVARYLGGVDALSGAAVSIRRSRQH